MPVEVTKVVEFDMGHRVPNHKSKCRNFHGHRYRLEVTLTGEVISTAGSSDEGMVCDFGDVKAVLMARVHDVLDHGFMYFEEDLQARTFFTITAPEMRSLAVPFIPTAENLAAWCYEQLKGHFPSGQLRRLRLYETPNSWADYQP